MTKPCDLLQAETELDLVEGALAVELPAHMRAFARAHAEGRSPPAAPPLLHLSSTLTAARHGCMHDVLLDRGLALLRLIVPVLIEADPMVAAARAQSPSWPGLQRLAGARDRAAQALFGYRALEVVHALNGTPTTSHGTATTSHRSPAASHSTAAALDGDLDMVGAPGPPIEGWQSRDPAVDATAIADAWQLIATRLGVSGSVRVDRSARAKAQPRAFVIEPKREVVIVVPEAIDTPAARFAILHELGHAFVAFAMTPGVPRVVDEAAASYVGRLLEPPTFLPPRWPSPRAVAARRRRLAIAVMLDQIERRLPALDDVPGSAPPWALWHDPGAQAAYVEAEAMADRVRAELGPSPPRGQLLRALTSERDRIDQGTQIAL